MSSSPAGPPGARPAPRGGVVAARLGAAGPDAGIPPGRACGAPPRRRIGHKAVLEPWGTSAINCREGLGLLSHRLQPVRVGVILRAA